MTIEQIQQLSEDKLDELLNNLCKSGRVIIPTFFTPESINEFYEGFDNHIEIKFTNDMILTIQKMVEDEFTSSELFDILADFRKQHLNLE